MLPQSSVDVVGDQLSSCAADRSTIHTPPAEISIAPPGRSLLGHAASAPLQSSSTPLPHSSGVGAPGDALQTTPVCSELQTSAPERRHAPSPTLHACPTGHGSSIPFLQSSSSPLQRS